MFLASLQDERDFLGFAVHCEVARYFVSALNGLGVRAFEFDGWELLRIEVVRLAQVFVTSFIGRINAIGFDRQLEG